MADTLKMEDVGEARAAYDLFLILRNHAEFQGEGIARVEKELELFVQCRVAAKGYKIDVGKLK